MAYFLVAPTTVGFAVISNLKGILRASKSFPVKIVFSFYQNRNSPFHPISIGIQSVSKESVSTAQNFSDWRVH